MIRVLLAEDQAMMRGALAVLLGWSRTSRWSRRSTGATQVVAAALRAPARTWRCWTSRCPGRDEAAAELRRRFPRAGS